MHRGATRLLRHRVLDEESVYRVISESEGLVELEVVRAPRLEPGCRFRLTAAAVRRMTEIEDPALTEDRPEPFPRWAAALKARLRA